MLAPANAISVATLLPASSEKLELRRPKATAAMLQMTMLTTTIRRGPPRTIRCSLASGARSSASHSRAERSRRSPHHDPMNENTTSAIAAPTPLTSRTVPSLESPLGIGSTRMPSATTISAPTAFANTIEAVSTTRIRRASARPDSSLRGISQPAIGRCLSVRTAGGAAVAAVPRAPRPYFLNEKSAR